jgi:hypothetical protein
MSKKKAEYCSLELLAENRPYANFVFYDKKQRRMLSSVDVVINLEYFDDDAVSSFILAR